jgi:molecular chaperone GrpE
MAKEDEAQKDTQAADDGAAAPEPAPPADPLAEVKGERDRYREQMLRTAADFDNFRKRMRKEVEEQRLRGREEMLRELLPVFDNFERALAHGSGGDAVAVVEGLLMVHKLLADTLARVGVTAIEETGVPFDPAVHDALQQEPSSDASAGTVLRVVSKGYRAGERLVRPASVVVAAPPAAAEPPDPSPDTSPGDGGTR